MADITVSLDEQYITVTEAQPISFTVDGALTGATGPQGIQGIQGPQGEPGQDGQDAEWGLITGTLSDQTDLQSALDDKADISSLSNVATSNDYNDLDNKPTILTSLDEMSGDSDDISEGSTNLFMTGGERSKLSGIESGADVTDPGNVASAGAVMTSGNQSISGKKTFDEEITSLVRAIAPSFTITSVWGSLATNAYYDSGWKYLDDGVAGLIESDGANGGFNFYYADDGDLGDPISWNQVLTLNSDGINALAHKIKNVADPTDNTDAVNKQTMQTALDGKVDKANPGVRSLYGVTAGGVAETIQVSPSANSTIPIRNASGQFDVGTPSSSTQVANKSYVDSAGALKLDLGGGNLTGSLGILATSGTPTHTLTLGSTSTGLVMYNTSDQTTNYERTRMYFASNQFNIYSEVAGSGTNRQINIGLSGARQFSIRPISSASGIFELYENSSTAGAVNTRLAGTLSQSSGNYTNLYIRPIINQSGSAGYTALLINPAESTTGSGAKNLIDAQVGGSSKFKVDNQGNVTANSINNSAISTGGGLIIVSHGATAGTARPSVSGAVIWVGSVDPTNAVNGDIYLQQ